MNLMQTRNDEALILPVIFFSLKMRILFIVFPYSLFSIQINDLFIYYRSCV